MELPNRLSAASCATSLHFEVSFSNSLRLFLVRYIFTNFSFRSFSSLSFSCFSTALFSSSNCPICSKSVFLAAKLFEKDSSPLSLALPVSLWVSAKFSLALASWVTELEDVVSSVEVSAVPSLGRFCDRSGETNFGLVRFSPLLGNHPRCCCC